MSTTEITVRPKHAGGAPTLYRPEYCAGIVEHFERMAIAPSPESVPVAETETEGKWKREYRVICAEIPTLLSFARSIGVSAKVLSEWQNRHPEFREACARAKDIGASLLSERALTGRYNAQFAQFAAKNLYGWSDKIEIDSTVTNSADSQTMDQMRQALAAASPDQLDQFRHLIEAMQSRVPAIDPA